MPGAACCVAPALPRGGRATSLPVRWLEAPLQARSTELQARSAGPRQEPAPEVSAELALLRRLSAVLQPPPRLLWEPGGVLDWHAPLLPYQKVGLAALVQRDELLLADDMGLGKTIQAIGALRVLFAQGEIRSALIACPASLTRQWARELRLWAPELRATVVAGPAQDRAALWQAPAQVKLVSYETLRGDTLELRDSPVLRRPWGVVILDEASRIKNRETGVARACKKVSAARRWALTGTPLENCLEDVLSILEFLDGEGRCRYGGRPAVLERLREVQLRRRKAEVLPELPPRRVIELDLELNPRQRAAYDEAEQTGVVHLRAKGDALRVTHVLELITRLKQLCNRDPVSGESAKMDDLGARIDTLVEQGHRALVFSQFTDQFFGTGVVRHALRRFQPLEYTGALSPGQRCAIVDRFTRDVQHKVLALSLRAGGVGLNLQSASYVFHLDRWWNPAIEEQADSRAHRMGQEFPVHVFRYICVDTIEERIDDILRTKRQLFQEVVDDVSLDLAQTLTEEELFGLFGLAPGRARSRPDTSQDARR